MTATDEDRQVRRSAWPLIHDLIAVAMGVAVWVLLHQHQTHAPMMRFLAHRRSALYPLAASLSGTILGFALASLTFVAGFASAGRLKIVRDSGWMQELLGVFVGSLRALAAALVLSLAALLFDTDAHPNRLMTSALAAAVVLSAARVTRLIFTLQKFANALLARGARRPGERRSTRALPASQDN